MLFSRVWACVVIVVTTVAVLTPLVPELRGRNQDSFPLSWYPMFAKERAAVERVDYVIGLTAEGKRVKIDTGYWSHGGLNQAARELTKILQRGPTSADELCEKIATRVGRQGSRRMKQVEEVQLVRGTYSRETWFGGDHEPITERVFSRCPVTR